MRKGLPAALLAGFVVTGCVEAPARHGAADIRLQLGLHYLAVKDYAAAQRNLLRAQQAARAITGCRWRLRASRRHSRIRPDAPLLPARAAVSAAEWLCG